jgi:hypothetical protein
VGAVVDLAEVLGPAGVLAPPAVDQYRRPS